MDTKDKIFHNEQSYYNRMNSTMTSKCDLLSNYMKNGFKVLDYGSGKSFEIAELVNSFEGKYVAVDREKDVQLFFEDSDKYECYPSIFSIPVNSDEDKFDIIFMSSVFHELLSYETRNNNALVINEFKKILKSNGLIIIRDWTVSNSALWESQSKVLVKKDKINEINIWIEKLKEKKILIKDIVIKENDNEFMLSGINTDIYNLIYHVTWGLKSILRESNEDYSINENEINRFFGSDYDTLEYNSIKDESYEKYMSVYFNNYHDLIESNALFLPKCLLVLRKK